MEFKASKEGREDEVRDREKVECMRLMDLRIQSSRGSEVKRYGEVIEYLKLSENGGIAVTGSDKS